jgi:hypothetical protein
MPPTLRRSLGRANGSVGPAPLFPRATPMKPGPAPGLKILVAGVDKDARGAVEATVRQALGSRAASGSWSVSVVSLAGKFSVTLDGPGDRLRGLSFVADRDRLAEAVRGAVEADPERPGHAATTPAAPAGSPTETRDRHVCEHCGQALLVVYELQPGEPKRLAPLACPHCWKVGHVEVGAWAAAGREYRAEKA